MTALSTADVAQALGERATVLAGIGAVWPGAHAVGPAFPCACAPGDNLALHAALARAPAGSVIVCDAGGDGATAYAGDLMALDAARRGLAGLVVDGAVRDTATIEELGLAVFATGACPLPPVKRVARSVGEEIVRRGVRVRPGDLVVADRDGVLVLADAEPDEVERAVAAVREREAAIRARIERGEGLAAQLGIELP